MIKVLAQAIGNEPTIMGEVPDDWVASEVMIWAQPKINEPFIFNIQIGSMDNKPVWILYEV